MSSAAIKMTSMLKSTTNGRDENEIGKINKVKQFGVTKMEVAKRAALGDLKINGVSRIPTGKDAIQKENNDAKALNNALKTTKARVDSHWKKPPLGTIPNGTLTSQLTNAYPNGAGAGIAQNKVITRSHSVRLGTSTTDGSGPTGIRQGTGLTAGQGKAKVLTAKVIDNKAQQVKHITRGITKTQDDKSKISAPIAIDQKLRREDSNLSRKSLTKLKAALKRDNVVNAAKPVCTGDVKKAVLSLQKKEVTVTKIPSVTRLDKLNIIPVQAHSSKLLQGIEDIDAEDGGNLMLVSQYVNDIYNYLYTLETKQAILPNYMSGQVEVTYKMRAVLLDWLNEVHLQFHLAPETYQMAVAIVDRYLQLVKDTKRTHLQLVGVTALFIAAKYEELLPPAISDFVYITDDTYTARQILQMEIKIFKALDCNLSRPLPIHFLRRFSKAVKANELHHAMSKYFLELCTIEYGMSVYKPSEIAAASLFLSLHLLNDDAKVKSGFNNEHWIPTVEYYSRYTADHLRPISRNIAEIAKNAPQARCKAVYSKYQSSNLFKISVRPELYSPLMDSIISYTEEGKISLWWSNINEVFNHYKEQATNVIAKIVAFYFKNKALHP